jgi:hypothetical protein
MQHQATKLVQAVAIFRLSGETGDVPAQPARGAARVKLDAGGGLPLPAAA